MRRPLANVIAVFLVLIFVSAAKADRYVLMVGVDHVALQKNDKDVNSAMVREVANAFLRNSRDLPGVTKSRILLGPNATREKTLQGLKWLSQMNAGDTAFVYFEMHGSGDAKKGYTGYLAGYTAKRKAETTISGEELREALANLAGPSVLCLDSCHSGSIIAKGGEWGKCLPLASCRPKELSYKKVMGPAAIEALEGEAGSNGFGVVTVKDFRDYVRYRMPQIDNRQHPMVLENRRLDRVSLTRPR